MNFIYRAASFSAGVLFLTLAGIGHVSMSAQAQTNSKPPLKIITEAQTRELLTQKVQLKLEETTLPVVMQALSEQTGLQIEAAGYLREHRLLMCMSDVSALTVLETLGELNDWKWQVTEPGHVLLGRPQPRTPLKVADVSLAMQAALPKDFRRFIGSSGNLRDAMYMPLAVMSKRENEALKLHPPNPIEYGLRDIHMSNMVRGMRFFDMLKPQILDQKPLLCTRLTLEQQQTLRRVLALTAFEPVLLHQHNLLNGVMRPHQRDPENIDVAVQNGNTMLIGTYLDKIINGKRDVQGSFISYQVDAPATGDDKFLHFGGSHH